MKIILKFRCIWCFDIKLVTLERTLDETVIDVDDYRVCTRCKLERKHAVSGA